MKRYYITVPREYQFYFTVVGRDEHEARFQAMKQLIMDVLDQKVPIDITDGHTVQACELCTDYFPPGDLTEVEGKQVCARCKPYAQGDLPNEL